jgi:hypothetical protein
MPYGLKNENRSNNFIILFSNGDRTVNIRIQQQWTIREIMIILFLNGIINNLETNKWNFRCNGRNLEITNNWEEAAEWSILARGKTIFINQLQKGRVRESTCLPWKQLIKFGDGENAKEELFNEMVQPTSSKLRYAMIEAIPDTPFAANFHEIDEGGDVITDYHIRTKGKI